LYFVERLFRRITERGAKLEVGNIGDITLVLIAIEYVDMVVFH
jgi:hypothetical protein